MKCTRIGVATATVIVVGSTTYFSSNCVCARKCCAVYVIRQSREIFIVVCLFTHTLWKEHYCLTGVQIVLSWLSKNFSARILCPKHDKNLFS